MSLTPLESFSADRRQEPRQAASGGVRLVLKSGHALDAELVDRSLKGMRLRLADAASLSPELSVVSLASAAIYEARLMWRTPPYAGLMVTRTVDMRAPASPQDAHFHRMWREHARG